MQPGRVKKIVKIFNISIWYYIVVFHQGVLLQTTFVAA